MSVVAQLPGLASGMIVPVKPPMAERAADNSPRN